MPLGERDGDSELDDEEEENQEVENDLTAASEEVEEGQNCEDALENEVEGGEEFTDREHESQFCLETNFSGGQGVQETAESTAEQEDKEGE